MTLSKHSSSSVLFSLRHCRASLSHLRHLEKRPPLQPVVCQVGRSPDANRISRPSATARLFLGCEIRREGGKLRSRCVFQRRIPVVGGWPCSDLGSGDGVTRATTEMADCPVSVSREGGVCAGSEADDTRVPWSRWNQSSSGTWCSNSRCTDCANWVAASSSCHPPSMAVNCVRSQTGCSALVRPSGNGRLQPSGCRRRRQALQRSHHEMGGPKRKA